MRWPAAVAFSIVWVALVRAQPFPDGPGREIFEKQCSTCHSLEVIVAQRHDAAEWRALVLNMIDRGAELTDDQVPVVVDYLSANWSTPGDAPAEAPAERPSAEQRADTPAARSGPITPLPAH